MTYTSVFGGNTINSSDTSYAAFSFAESFVLEWPRDAGSDPAAVDIMDINASTTSLTVTLPDATLASTGTVLAFNNVGAYSVTILDASGNLVLTVVAGVTWLVYLRDNTSVAGLWRSYQLGAGSSSTSAAALAGAGLTVLSDRLTPAYIATSTNITNTTLDNAARGEVMVWTGVSGAFKIAAPSTLSSGWYVSVKNAGTGTLTINPDGAVTIDDAATISMAPEDSCIIFTDGIEFFTIGLGKTATSSFSATAINISAAGDYTLNVSEYSNIAMSFTGALAADKNVIVPNAVREYRVTNNTTGGFNVVVKTAAGTGITVAAGAAEILYSDGVNVYNSVTIPSFTPGGAVGSLVYAANDTATAQAAIDVYSTTDTVALIILLS